jgi:site-specific recombinase XerD
MVDALPLSALIDSWLIYLQSERKQPGTIRSYRTGVNQYLAWCATEGHPQALQRPLVAAWLAGLLRDGRDATTVTSRLTALKALSRWLADPDNGEGIPDTIATLKAPKQDTKVVHTLDDEQLRALIAACRGPRLRDRRDEAVTRVLIETGARASEIANLLVGDVDLLAGSVVISRGKGGRGRRVPIGPATTRAVDKYLRVRRTQKQATSTDRLWLGEGGRGFGYDGLYKSLKWRADLAGIKAFHPHQLRHTAATRWLSAGGSESGAMQVMGWSRVDLLRRYTQANRERLAADEARRLGLGDL